MPPTPVIIDCDPGHDDVFALWLAIGNPALDVRAVTTVAGNGSLEHTTLNARIALSVAGVHGIPVSAGASHPLSRKAHAAVDIHGENALGGPARLPTPTVPLDPRDAITLIADTLLASPEPVTLIPTGPLTNIAALITQRPDVIPRIREIIWMGGAVDRGNVTPYAEFNAWADPEAADIVFRAAQRKDAGGHGVRLTMVGLNITHQALVTDEVIARVEAVGNNTAAFGVQLLKFFCKTYAEVQGMPAAPLHDPVTVAIAIDRAVATVQRTHVVVETKGEYTAGATNVYLLDQVKGRDLNVEVAMQLDVKRFFDLIVEAIGRLA
ncbi:Inosine-uridine preferring nucleoside hydrolase [Vanrija pseudolonga]|uniref:Inosine-uridine preferring nucleoside hydrolase n=1 Tax=Vanrija pseudolonga TaxID=143232 RepID=A0AAF0YFT4_9TREE|nr:Inosine-uridine preferring nucleoside hydrolase [Vanrija pseudolonga]